MSYINLANRPNSVDHQIAHNLRQFRMLAGMTQDDLGSMAGITFQQVQKYEKGQNRVSASRLFEFSQILRRPMSDFFQGAEKEKGDGITYSNRRLKASQVNFDKDMITLIKAFNNIEDQQSKRNLVALAGSLARRVVKNVKRQAFL